MSTIGSPPNSWDLARKIQHETRVEECKREITWYRVIKQQHGMRVWDSSRFTMIWEEAVALGLNDWAEVLLSLLD